MNITSNHEFQIQLLESVINPVMALTGCKIRARAAPTKIKALYHLYQLNKNILNGKWLSQKNYQGKTRIAKEAKISKKHFSEFINSPDFNLFGKVTHRDGETNIYYLEPWLVEAFQFFERKGMMKDFRENFIKWKDRFLKRLHKWLLPLLRKGHSLKDILMNKLCTKQKLKGDGCQTLKGDGMNLFEVPFMKPTGSKSKPEELKVPGFDSYLKVGEKILNFGLQDADILQVMRDYSLNHHKKACNLFELWKKRGIEIHSPVKLYQTCLNRTKYGNP